MRQSKKTRNENQRARQQQLRVRAKATRRPSRDDIARILLHWFIVRVSADGHRSELDRVEDAIVERLVLQGFDENQSYDACEQLIERYTRGHWDFRRKVHLPPPITS